MGILEMDFERILGVTFFISSFHSIMLWSARAQKFEILEKKTISGCPHSVITTTTLKLMTISLQGLTVRLEGHKVTVARILIDSIIDRQGLLKTGDVILQANGKNIKDPEQLQTAIEESGAFVVFKILPSNIDQQEEENSKPKAGKAAKVLKFIYSEKATKFCEVSTLLLSVCTVDKSKVEISQNFVAFSEYTNFT